jgi:FkbM family methyltransferase
MTISERDAGDAPFRHYSLKQRCVAWVSQHLFDHVTYTARRGLNKGMKRRGGLGWLPEFLDRTTETAEHRFLTGLDLKDRVVYDVGAFHGMMALFFAREASQVVCYEPDAANRKRLQENLSLNRIDNVQVRPLGVGAEKSTATLVTTAAAPGGATIDPEIAESLLKSGGGVSSTTIEITTLDQDIVEAGLPAPEFVKIDIEGAELAALQGMTATLTAHSPALFMEIHGETMNQKRKNVSDIVAHLAGLSYQILHVETGTLLNSGNADVGARGHLYCWSGTDLRRRSPTDTAA